jgi:hypothetical protein
LRISPVSTKTHVSCCADRFGDERGGDGGVDAPRERAEHLLRTDLLANRGDLIFDDRCIRPRQRDPRDVVQEVCQEFLSAFSVHHFGMKLDGVQSTRDVFHHRDRSFG